MIARDKVWYWGRGIVPMKISPVLNTKSREKQEKAKGIVHKVFNAPRN